LEITSFGRPESFFLLLIATLFALVMFLLLRRRKPLEPVGPPPPPYSKPASPLQRLSFEEAMDVVRFSEAISDYGRENLLFSVGADPANMVIQALAIGETHGGLTLVCEMTETGRHLFNEGKAVLALHRDSGAYLPILRDKDTKTFVEILRGKPATSQTIANLASLIVSTAHVISSMDVARRLGNIERKLERMEEYRKEGQYATLERIYLKSKEAIARGDGVSLLGYRDELCQLRIEWRRELEVVLRHAPEPQWSWKSDWGTPRKWGTQSRRDKQLKDHILPELFRLPSIRMAYLVDLCLAEATGTLPHFIEHVLPDETRALEKLFLNLQAQFSKITVAEHKHEFRSGLEMYRSLVEPQRRLLHGSANGAQD
jgi:hypothetical protein